MPIYIVRWPDMSACLVRANNEDHLVDLLDQVADPGIAKWKAYNGPLWIDFHFPLWGSTFEEKEAARRAENPPMDEGGFRKPTNPGCLIDGFVHPPHSDAETNCNMLDEILKATFPYVAAAVEKVRYDHDCISGKHYDKLAQPEKDLLAAALRAEMAEDKEYEQRAEEIARRTDPAAQVMRHMNLTVPISPIGEVPRDFWAARKLRPVKVNLKKLSPGIPPIAAPGTGQVTPRLLKNAVARFLQPYTEHLTGNPDAPITEKQYRSFRESLCNLLTGKPGIHPDMVHDGHAKWSAAIKTIRHAVTKFQPFPNPDAPLESQAFNAFCEELLAAADASVGTPVEAARR